MRDEKTNASIASHFIEKALRALGTHRAWECPIHPGQAKRPPCKFTRFTVVFPSLLIGVILNIRHYSLLPGQRCAMNWGTGK
jgi:hypothetical protein